MDQLALRKVTVLVSGFVTCIFLSVAVSIDVEQWPAMVGFAVIGVMFYSLMQAIYNSLLVHVSETNEDEVVFVSAVQCAIGNFGAMVLMTALGLEEAKHSKKVIPIDYVQRCFLWSALWFFLFALPFAFVYQEEPRHGKVHNMNLTHQVRSAISAFKLSLQVSLFSSPHASRRSLTSEPRAAQVHDSHTDLQVKVRTREGNFLIWLIATPPQHSFPCTWCMLLRSESRMLCW